MYKKSEGKYTRAPEESTIQKIKELDDLGHKFYEDEKYVEAFNCFKESAGLGSVSGMFNTACMLEQGRGVTKDINASVKWYEQADQAGDLDATNNLGNIYFKGKGTVQGNRI